MKQLILAEKPSVARELAGVLGHFESKDGWLENNQYVVTWAVGHLVQLTNPEDYNPELKKWALEALPIMPESFSLKANPQTIKQFKVVKKLINRSDVQELVCATDAGREGELIFRYIYKLSGCRKPFKRLWLSETTPAAVRKGFENLLPGSEFDSLAAAAEARSQADWLIGINATRAFTVKHNNLLSVGRVQTPTLALIVCREREIKDFVSAPFWELYAEFTKDDDQNYTGKWFLDDQTRFATQEDARSVESRVKNNPAAVIQVEEKEIREQPPMLFNLNDLQKEANKKFGMSAARTLEVAQSLYESKKLITYPRTDSRHITQALATTIPDRLAALDCVESYKFYVQVAQQVGDLGKRYVNDSKVTDHTALLPTNIKPGNLSPEELKIYDLVARRFLAAFYPNAEYKQTRVVTETAGETFVSSGRVELAQGWKTVYVVENESGDENADGGNIPKLAQGEKVKTGQTEILQKKTQPPKRYTEASLLTVMEGASRLMEDKELKDAMKGHGLGTPATRAAVIERLIKVGYIERSKKTLIPTAKGETLIDLVPEIIKSPEMTGQWEKTLSDIETGSADPEEFMDGITQLTKLIVELARSQESSYVGQTQSMREVLGKCPVCGKDVVESGKGYGCSGYRKGCKFVIWKEMSGKKITAAQAKALLEKGKTGTIKGFTNRDGKKFDVVLQIKDDKVVFQFPENNGSGSDNSKQAIGKCPLCGKDVTESGKGYGCSGYREGCKFVIWKEISGKKITTAQAKELIQKGKTNVIKGFKSKNSKEFDASLVLVQDGKVNFKFANGQ